jgi:hypothetical protein
VRGWTSLIYLHYFEGRKLREREKDAMPPMGTYDVKLHNAVEYYGLPSR